LLRKLYERPEEEGLQKFEESLTRQLAEYQERVADSVEIRELTQLIAETNKKMQMRFKREHEYKLEKYEERLYKEVIYDTRPQVDPEGEKVLGNPLKKARMPTKIRNVNETAQEALKIARWPIHPARQYKVQNMHEPAGSKLHDPYHWVQYMSDQDREFFKRAEEEYYQLVLLKYDLLHKQLIREQEFYQHVPRILPIRIGDYIYYRRFENPADSLTVYRFPLEELKACGLNEGQVPNLRLSEDENVESIEDFPEQPVFGLGDMKEFYHDFAGKDPRIKDFVERVADFVVTQDYQPLHSFQISEE
jgi:hypothetical protein